MTQIRLTVYEEGMAFSFSFTRSNNYSNCGVKELHDFRLSVYEEEHFNKTSQAASYVTRPDGRVCIPFPRKLTKDKLEDVLERLVIPKMLDYFAACSFILMSDRVAGTSHDAPLMDEPWNMDAEDFLLHQAASFNTRDLMYFLARKGIGTITLSHIASNPNHEGHSLIQAAVWTPPQFSRFLAYTPTRSVFGKKMYRPRLSSIYQNAARKRLRRLADFFINKGRL